MVVSNIREEKWKRWKDLGIFRTGGPALSRPYYHGVVLTLAAWNASEASLEVAVKNKPEMRLYPVPCDGAVGTLGGESGTLGPTLDLPQLALHVAYNTLPTAEENSWVSELVPESATVVTSFAQTSPRPRIGLVQTSCRPCGSYISQPCEFAQLPINFPLRYTRPRLAPSGKVLPKFQRCIPRTTASHAPTIRMYLASPALHQASVYYPGAPDARLTVGCSSKFPRELASMCI